MSKWDYSLDYKANLTTEQTRIIYEDLEVAATAEKINISKMKSQSSTKANMELYKDGYTDPPYMANTNTQIITLEKDTKFVRVLNDKNYPLGKWFMLEDDIKGLSALEIQNKYAIPVTPTKYIQIKIPAGSTIRVGTANGLYGFSGGGVQFDNYGLQMFEDWIVSDYIFL